MKLVDRILLVLSLVSLAATGCGVAPTDEPAENQESVARAEKSASVSHGLSTPDCYTDSQCGAGRVCRDGLCWMGCQSDCDCGGTAYVCHQGICLADFGPYPECRQNCHCGYRQRCDNNICVDKYNF